MSCEKEKQVVVVVTQYKETVIKLLLDVTMSRGHLMTKWRQIFPFLTTTYLDVEFLTLNTDKNRYF